MKIPPIDQVEIRVQTVQAALRLYRDADTDKMRSEAKQGVIATLLGMLRYAQQLDGN